MTEEPMTASLILGISKL